MTQKEKRNLLIGLSFISPWIIGFLIFTLYPVIASMYYSLCDYSAFEKPYFMGLTNYIDLFNDAVFWLSLRNTFYYAIISIPLGIFCSILISLLLNSDVKGMSIFRTFFYIPSLVPIVALSMLWLTILNSRTGLLNTILKNLFGIQGYNWLDSKELVIPSLVFMGLWGVGGSMVIFLAGLQDVPKSLYESAEIDGANYFQKTIHITLPIISPIIYFSFIMGIIGTMQIFSQPYIMTGGGPERASTFYALYLYQRAFEDYEMGYASAMAWILFVIILTLTLISNKVSKKMVYYQGE